MRGILAAAAVLAAGVALNAEAQSPTKMPGELLWGSIVVVQSEPCCEQMRQFQLPPSRDAPLIGALRERAFRNGPILTLQLDRGRSLKIVDIAGPCMPPEDCRKHELIAWWPKHRLYVVDVVMHEAGQAYLISAHDGRATRVSAPPLTSPSGRYAIAWDASPLIGNPMELIDLRSDPPLVREVKGKPACPGTGQQYGIRPDPVWLDDSRVTFEGKSLFGSDDPNAKQLLRIVDGRPEWEC